eukprot:2150638-Pleurochrysis_carterae.AAC.1
MGTTWTRAHSRVPVADRRWRHPLNRGPRKVARQVKRSLGGGGLPPPRAAAGCGQPALLPTPSAPVGSRPSLPRP